LDLVANANRTSDSPQALPIDLFLPKGNLKRVSRPLARQYYDTHDPEIPEEIYELARRLREMDHWKGRLPNQESTMFHCGVGLKSF
jgi:hypothetical protein